MVWDLSFYVTVSELITYEMSSVWISFVEIHIPSFNEDRFCPINVNFSDKYVI